MQTPAIPKTNSYNIYQLPGLMNGEKGVFEIGVSVKVINTGSAPLNKVGNMYLKSKLKEGVFDITRPD